MAINYTNYAAAEDGGGDWGSYDLPQFDPSTFDFSQFTTPIAPTPIVQPTYTPPATPTYTAPTTTPTNYFTPFDASYSLPQLPQSVLDSIASLNLQNNAYQIPEEIGRAHV